MKKRIIIAVAVLVIFCIAGTLTVLYNTPDIRIGMSYSDDGLVNFPMITCRSYLGGLGMSKSANEKWLKISNEYNKEYAAILTGYQKDLQLDTDISFEKGRTIIHFYGSGTPINGETKEKIDKTYTIDRKLKLENQ